jgi:hypothetical protein
MEFGNKLPINYKLKKLKAPVYLLSIYDDKTFYKVIKVACNNEDHITEYENYKVLLKNKEEIESIMNVNKKCFIKIFYKIFEE